MSIKYRVVNMRDTLIASLSATLHYLFFDLSPAKRPHPAEVIALLRECDYSHPIDLAMLFHELSLHVVNHTARVADEKMRMLAPADLERLAIGTGRLYRAHMASARFPARHIGHGQCLPSLQSYWIRVAEPFLNADERVIHGWVRLRDEVELHGILEDVPIPTMREYVQMPIMRSCINCKLALKDYVFQTTEILIGKLGVYFCLDEIRKRSD